MVLRFFLLAITLLFISCTDFQRDNPEDERSINYIAPSSSSSSNSSSSSRVSSSSIYVFSSSSVTPIVSSSSSEEEISSSSSALSSGSSVIPSSSSEEMSSSSSEPSSSSSTPSSSSSSIPPSSSSVVPSSSSVNVPSKGDDILNYRTVPIGSQVWMAENLDYDVSGSRCYNNDPANCAKYGRLYDWATAMALPSSCNSSSCASQVGTKHKGICPSGWHIPSDAEWTMLTNYVGEETSGSYLKSTSGWNNEGNGQDKYEFTALPGGQVYHGIYFGNMGIYGFWWSASEYDADNADWWIMSYDTEVLSVGFGGGKDNVFYSVRCLQN